MYTRAPIPWIVVAGTAFLGYMILMAWCAVRGPSDLGVTISSDSHSVVIDDVRIGSSAAAAGLRAGDRLLAPGGAPIRMVRLLGKPVELSLSSSWLIEQLPQDDVEYARNSRIELIIPVATGDGGVAWGRN